jgi:hypothetical protein
MMKIQTHYRPKMTFVRNEELLTAGEVFWPEGAQCADVAFRGEGLFINLQVSEEALNRLVQTGLAILKERYHIVEEASRGNSHN